MTLGHRSRDRQMSIEPPYAQCVGPGGLEEWNSRAEGHMADGISRADGHLQRIPGGLPFLLTFPDRTERAKKGQLWGSQAIGLPKVVALQQLFGAASAI